MKKYSIIALAFVLLASCTKEIDIDLNSVSPQIVIEGNISDEVGPYTVKLSRTIQFGQPNVYPSVQGATVIISDNTGIVDTLTETSAGLYQTHSIVGVQGNTYALKVLAEGKQYEAVCTMPHKINLDSVQLEEYTEPGESEKSLSVVPLYLDPVGLGNNYRFLIEVNGKEDKLYQVSNDNIGNGSVNQQPFFTDTEYIKIKKGDTVTVSMLCIDVSTYNYFYSLSQIGDGGLIGGAVPTNPPNNITGNKALGLFSAYMKQTKTVIAE
ncbi:protein of unknown function [Flexibacter flexilis DSM 6793]|uniref:DUF4249 domain-containing protein n=1 Tax=Flexibacter flexilis DSM 6793 TaxID=927664 RepID=A0A1I1F4Z4_9BACT|nr:DUF4249 domain-containing protein [Flexibacter flexilis]SFB94347.1 protein of unknown function [Flexibacter flexilis DSM 6793]